MSGREAAAPRRAAYHHGDLRRALLAAASALLAEVGPAALSLRAVARAAGVTHAAPYRHFPDKAALLAALATDGFERLRAAMDAAREAAGPDSGARLAAVGRAYVQSAVSAPAEFRLMFGAPAASRAEHPELEAAAAAAFGGLVDAVAEAQAGGQVRAGPIEPLALAAWAAMHGLAALAVDGQLPGPAEADADPVAAVQDVLRLGLAPREGGA